MKFPILNKENSYGDTDDEWYGMSVTEIDGKPAIKLVPPDFKNPNFFNMRQPRAVARLGLFDPSGIMIFSDEERLLHFYSHTVLAMLIRNIPAWA